MVAWATAYPTVRGVTRQQLLARILRATGLGTVGTATGGSLSTLINTTRLKSTQFSPRDWEGGWARHATKGISSITDYAPTTGIVTVNPDFSSGIAASDTYQLFKYPHPQDILDIIDQVLQEDIWLSSHGVATEIPDGNMQENNVTYWSGTVSKAESSFFGKKHLVIGAGQTATSVDIFVEAGKQYRYGGLIQPLNGTSTISIFNATTDVLLDSISTTHRFPLRLYDTVNIPVGCDTIYMTIKAERAYDAILISTNGDTVTLPEWVKSPDQVKGVFSLTPYDISTGIQGPHWKGTRRSRFNIVDDAFGNGLMRLSGGFVNEPVYIVATRNETAYASDTEVKFIDENYIATMVLWRLFEALKQQPTVAHFDSKWKDAEYKRWEREALIEQSKQLVRLESLINSPVPEAAYGPRF